MAKDVILPALGMSQDTGKIVQWLKSEGEQVVKGEPLAEIETDKATVEIEAPANGILAHVQARAGDDVPVGQVIALILSHNEVASIAEDAVREQGSSHSQAPLLATVRQPDAMSSPIVASPVFTAKTPSRSMAAVSTLASRIATDHNVDLSRVKPVGKRIQKADVLTYLQNQEATPVVTTPRLVMASPKARRLATETGQDLATIQGSGPDGAVLAADVEALKTNLVERTDPIKRTPTMEETEAVSPTMSTIWRIMAERTTQSWTDVPHFYLTREVNVTRLVSWREHIVGTRSVASTMSSGAAKPKITYTDLLVKIVAASLRMHPRLNAEWSAGKITLQPEIHVGLAVAVEDGLVVPVIHKADLLSLNEIAQQRVELVAKAQTGKLRPQDISGGTFTISNLGMYNVDAFNAIINQPQVGILAVGRIAERVVPVHGQPAVQPMMVLTLSCDHRAVDGARGAQFLESIATLIEEPLGLLV